MFTLEPLQYNYDALEDAIDEETMKIHHDKHHQAYVDKLNDAIKGTEYENKTIEYLLTNLDKLPEDIRTTVRNNGGGHYNHMLFWETMAPRGVNEPVGKLKEAIDNTFGSFNDFKKEFENKGVGRFGSGWVNLVQKDGKLEIVTSVNQDSPITDGYEVIIGNDIWEHAYYLRYQNKRPEYLKNWWKVVNWDVANKRFQ